MIKFNYTITTQQGKRRCPIKQIITMLCSSLILLITIGCNNLNKGYGAHTCSLSKSSDISSISSSDLKKKDRKKTMQLLAFCIFDQKVKQKFEQEIKKEIEQNIKQKIKQIFPRRNKCGTALENYYSEMVKRLLENGANSNDLFYEVIDKIASGYGPKGYDFKPKWREYKNKKARYYSSTDLLHILDYLLKNNLVDPYRHDKNGALPLAKLMFSGYLYTLLDVYNTNKCYVNGIDCCLDAVFLLLDYGANYEFKSGEIRKLLLNTVK